MSVNLQAPDNFHCRIAAFVAVPLAADPLGASRQERWDYAAIHHATAAKDCWVSNGE
ncbi:hypothetical protein [Phytopseudomonas argentinensis]|uniref:hypothetical protein n=1 Tax=Phytopseudomonas argentinensis TaxID=289370 RepID=UPI001428A895|nr:hypothetical protein [Pseudomonas argentinensis]